MLNTFNLRKERFILAHISVHSQLAAKQDGLAEAPGGRELDQEWKLGGKISEGRSKEDTSPPTLLPQ